ncbi:hypothetical protein CYLTODRAFT_489477 [Cylindrobasidium torrendii FP15055 ss-10]|uniref:Calcofluor white hypersensitive protein n=1 Tax=Cylindrobasidium torrendii FP15055 ss-10 TaxID=1314674 RepID=A0A0D7BE92_9AGAR|nr:hypothetical protein CYLTODRAFT_489477 [Cylindrobasidium torrendii FP15055 ss-10]
MPTSMQPRTLRASWLVHAHTWLAYAAFSSALLVGCTLHYKKIVKNGVARYPQEWFPSVSAAIGDWYPERNIFQILIALTAGPRLALVALQHYIHGRTPLSDFVFIVGLLRTLLCGGWVFITSSDDHDVHDICMIGYIVCNIPWMLGTVKCSKNVAVHKARSRTATAFFTTIIPLVYFYIQHKVYRVPGAYTRYAFFEWGLIFLDVFFDSYVGRELEDASIQIIVQSSPAASTLVKSPEHIAYVDEEHSVKGRPVSESNGYGSISPSTMGSTTSGFVADIYLSYVFWSIFTSLIPTLFYFSVWELGIAGHELAFLAVLSPFLLSRIPDNKLVDAVLHLLSFAALGAYALPRPLYRLLVVTPAAMAAVMVQARAWSRDSSTYQATVTSLGFLIGSLLKHANHSNNPIWPSVNADSGGYNRTGILLALVALIQTLLRTSTPVSSSKFSAPAPSGAHQISAISAALPLGSLFYILHTLYTNTSTIIACTWTGYENGSPRGPLPHLYGALTLLFQCAGIIYGMLVPLEDHLSIPHAAFLVAYASTSLSVFYYYPDWAGYIGGLCYGAFAMAILPRALSRASASASRRGPAIVFGWAMVIYVMLMLAGVWTVAYAFVPGGVYLRERTDLVYTVHLACLLPLFWPSGRSASRNSDRINATTKVRTMVVMFVVCALAVASTLHRLPSHAIQPFRSGPRIVRSGIWTIHFGVDNAGRDSQRSILRVVKDLELDVIGLLESDVHRPVFGNRDLTSILVEDGYYVDLGPGPNEHTWGAALLSKFPIINSTHYLLPSPYGELAPAIEAVLDIFGTPVTVVVSHNGQEEDALDRELQSIELAHIMDASPHPVIFLGYIVSKPHAERPSPYKILVEDGRMHDIDITQNTLSL